MKYIHVKTLSESQFKRLVGVKISTFSEMLDILKEAQKISGRGRPSRLPLEDQLLMALSYWREYRTLFHTAMSYGVHESSASRIITKIENILIKSKKFHLPKKLPQGQGIDWEVIVVDATEMTIERPKKTKEIL
ncbi:transposase family protein [Acinetobacter sp. MD2(2019)]|uniref:transposase family protein n=1 Tax=Acinetobacter sp. MD2(2019) TaxID=2605273 RepID=UPI002D1F7C22|nr:transposase family protein [Acinetobacter sp. MD2(2019)]MEB3754897.1 transposase family protein [Acinetobacter sp. MD2(2019)]